MRYILKVLVFKVLGSRGVKVFFSQYRDPVVEASGEKLRKEIEEANERRKRFEEFWESMPIKK